MALSVYVRLGHSGDAWQSLGTINICRIENMIPPEVRLRDDGLLNAVCHIYAHLGGNVRLRNRRHWDYYVHRPAVVRMVSPEDMIAHVPLSEQVITRTFSSYRNEEMPRTPERAMSHAFGARRCVPTDDNFARSVELMRRQQLQQLPQNAIGTDYAVIAHRIGREQEQIRVAMLQQPYHLQSQAGQQIRQNQVAGIQFAQVHNAAAQWWGREVRRHMENELGALRYTTQMDQTSPSTTEAAAVAWNLLLSHLTDEQKYSLNRNHYFDVTAPSGNRYRIHTGTTMNIYMTGKMPGHKKVGQHRLCFLPRGGLPQGDVMLAQKLAIELRESDVLKTAHHW